MDRHLGRAEQRLLLFGCLPLLRPRSCSRQAAKRSAPMRPCAALEQLPQHRPGVADDADVELRGWSRSRRRRCRCGRPWPRRRSAAARRGRSRSSCACRAPGSGRPRGTRSSARSGRRAGGRPGSRRGPAAWCRTGCRLLDERLQLGSASDQITPLPATMIGLLRRLEQATSARRPRRRRLRARLRGSGCQGSGQSTCARVDLLAQHVARQIEVDRAGLAGHRVRGTPCSPARGCAWRDATRSAHLVQGSMIATWSISWNAPRPQVPTGRAPPSATDRGAVDPGVGDAGDQVDHARARGGHAHAGRCAGAA